METINYISPQGVRIFGLKGEDRINKLNIVDYFKMITKKKLTTI